MTSRWAAVLCCLLSGAAMAWPVDVQHDLTPKQEKFIKLAEVDWVQVEDPSVVTAEALESGELLLTGLKPGSTLLLLYAQGQFAVWRLRVGPKPKSDTAALAAALKACPEVKHQPKEYDKLVGAVKTQSCRAALLATLRTDDWVAKELDLTFDASVFQAQLKQLQQSLDALKLKVAARYVGATLELSGELTPEQQRRVLWEAFKASAGRVLLDDRTHVATGQTDAGER